MGLNTFTTTGGLTLEGMLLLNKTISLYGGGGLLLDSDLDSGFRATVDDTIELFIAGAVDFTFTHNQMLVESAASINGQGDNIVDFTPAANPQSLVGAGGITNTQFCSKWTTTAADAATLPDGAAIGQLKKVILIVDGGDGTLTPTNFQDGVSVVFADAGDFVIFKWESVGWTVIDSGNTVDGVTFPATI